MGRGFLSIILVSAIIDVGCSHNGSGQSPLTPYDGNVEDWNGPVLVMDAVESTSEEAIVSYLQETYGSSCNYQLYTSWDDFEKNAGIPCSVFVGLDSSSVEDSPVGVSKQALRATPVLPFIAAGWIVVSVAPAVIFALKVTAAVVVVGSYLWARENVIEPATEYLIVASATAVREHGPQVQQWLADAAAGATVWAAHSYANIAGVLQQAWDWAFGQVGAEQSAGWTLAAAATAFDDIDEIVASDFQYLYDTSRFDAGGSGCYMAVHVGSKAIVEAISQNYQNAYKGGGSACRNIHSMPCDYRGTYVYPTRAAAVCPPHVLIRADFGRGRRPGNFEFYEWDGGIPKLLSLP